MRKTPEQFPEEAARSAAKRTAFTSTKMAAVQLAALLGFTFGLYAIVAGSPCAGLDERTAGWSHAAELGAGVRLLWTLCSDEMVFRMEARTHGYVGLGLSRNGRMAGADMVIGWVRDGQAFLQDRHGVPRDETELDAVQSWFLIAGFENETHTSLIFKRKLDTCDREDVRITNDTMRVIYAFDDKDPDPLNSSIRPHAPAHKGVKSLLLIQHSQGRKDQGQQLLQWDLLSHQVIIPNDQDTLYWCKLFRLPNVTAKHHIVGYEPLIRPGHEAYTRHLVVRECASQGPSDDIEFEAEVASEGHRCHFDLPQLLKSSCQTLLAVWTPGSRGVLLPDNIGFPLGQVNGTKYFQIEIHYDNPHLKRGIRITSGLRIFYTPILRPLEAGLFSVGVDPDWKHMIPPDQSAVVSYGHCVGQCTQKAFPTGGIHVFAAVLHSHLIGRKLQLRHFRNGTEMASVAADTNYDSEYQEVRAVAPPVHVLPGDHLVAECTYNSRGREGMTSGGFSAQEEKCLVFVFHYPRIEMVTCHSLPTLATVYASVGVEEMWKGRVPERIRRPNAFANLTLTEHVASHDWSKHFKRFQDVTKRGSFQAICGQENKPLLLGSHVFRFPNITRRHHEPKSCSQEAHRPHPVHKEVTGSTSAPQEVRPRKPKENARKSTTTTTTTTEKMQASQAKSTSATLTVFRAMTSLPLTLLVALMYIANVQ